MPYFLHQVSYTPEALARLIANPQDRFEAVRAHIEKLGGRCRTPTSHSDSMTLCSSPRCRTTFPPPRSPWRSPPGGSLRNCQTTALMSNAESLEAMRKAATCGYKPVVAAASGAAARP